MSELGPCKECNEDISLEATTCPQCGNNPAKTAKWSSIGIMFLGVLAVPFLWPVGLALLGLGLAARIGMYWVDYSPTEYAF